jgi:hypothetical protein
MKGNMNNTSSPLTAFKRAPSLGLSPWENGNLTTNLAEKKDFKVEAGECVFLPRFKPHAFVIRSPRLHVLALFTPAGLEEAFRGMSTPAQRLELPTGAVTYSTGDLKQTAQRLSKYGARFLAQDEIADQLPLYPNPTTEPTQVNKKRS